MRRGKTCDCKRDRLWVRYVKYLTSSSPTRERKLGTQGLNTTAIQRETDFSRQKPYYTHNIYKKIKLIYKDIL